MPGKILTKAKIAELLKAGNFMVRMDDGEGKGHGGFQWEPLGKWTTCPRWRPESHKKPACDNGGLFGQSPMASGYTNTGKRLVLCETKGRQVPVGTDKVKVRKAMHLAYDGDIPTKLLNAIPGLSLYLSGCDLKGITLPSSVGGYLDLRGCDLKGITLPSSVGGSLYLRGCDLKGITLPSSVGGSLDLSGCDLKGITLPSSVGGYLDLSGCDLKGITLPTNLKKKVRV